MPRDLHRVVGRDAAVADPVVGRDAHRHRLVVGPHRAHRAEHLEREAHAVLEAAAVLVGALVGQRRDEGREQVAVRGSAARACRSRRASRHLASRATNCVDDARPCRRGPSPSGIWLRGDQGIAEADITGQLPSRERRVDLLPAELRSSPCGRSGRAGSRSWPSVSACTKSTMRFHAASCSGAYSPVQPGVMRPSGDDAGHLGVDQAGAALGALGVVDEVPVGRAAVDRLVLRHRRDDDAVLQLHARAAGTARTSARRAGVRPRRPAPGTSPRRPRSQLGSRSRRFSWLMRCERVSSE